MVIIIILLGGGPVENKVRTVAAIIIPVFLFVLFTASYQRYLPQKSVVELLDHYKSLQYDNEDIAIRLSTTSSVETVFLNKVLPTMHYKVLEINVTDDQATVKVQISNVNLDMMLEDYEAGLVEQTIKPVIDEELTSVGSKIDDFEISVLVNLIDNPDIKKQYVTRELELNLTKVDGNWVLEDNDELFKAMLGYDSDEISLQHLNREVNYLAQ